MIIQYTSIMDHIMKLQEIAAEGGRIIEYLVLSEAEVRELNRELGVVNKVTYNPEAIMGTVLGVQIVGIKYHSAQMRRS